MRLPTGYEGTRANRCVDRFVRYPYPKLFTNYKQNFPNKAEKVKVISHKQAFNLEKETKIINPHKMDMGTTTAHTYTGRKGLPSAPADRRIVEEPKPIL